MQPVEHRWAGIDDPAAVSLRAALTSLPWKAEVDDVDVFIKQLCDVRRQVNEVISLATMLWDSGALLGPRGQLPVLRLHLLRRTLQRCCHATQRSALHTWRRRCLLQRSLEEFLAKSKLAGCRELRQWLSPRTPRTVYQGPPRLRRPVHRNEPVPTTTAWEEALATPRADAEEARICARLRERLTEAHAATQEDATAVASRQLSARLAHEREATVLEECAQLRQSLQAVEEREAREARRRCEAESGCVAPHLAVHQPASASSQSARRGLAAPLHAPRGQPKEDAAQLARRLHDEQAQVTQTVAAEARVQQRVHTAR